MSKKALREFWAVHPQAEIPLAAWYKVLSAATWHTFAELRATYNSADLVGNCVVFNVGGNNYRVITRVLYAKRILPGVVYVLRVMAHAEYDENKWLKPCGCYSPPPTKSKAAGKRTRKKK